jgi:hypothetical protein
VYLLIIDHPPFKPYFAQILTWTFLQTGWAFSDFTMSSSPFLRTMSSLHTVY